MIKINKFIGPASVLALAVAAASPALAKDYTQFGIEKDLPGTCSPLKLSTLRIILDVH